MCHDIVVHQKENRDSIASPCPKPRYEKVSLVVVMTLLRGHGHVESHTRCVSTGSDSQAYHGVAKQHFQALTPGS
jgi:hypothetical protein